MTHYNNTCKFDAGERNVEKERRKVEGKKSKNRKKEKRKH